MRDQSYLVDILFVISIEIPRLKNNYVVMLLRANETVRLLTLFYNGIIVVLIYYTKEGTLVILNTVLFKYIAFSVYKSISSLCLYFRRSNMLEKR